MCACSLAVFRNSSQAAARVPDCRPDADRTVQPDALREHAENKIVAIRVLRAAPAFRIGAGQFHSPGLSRCLSNLRQARPQ